MNNLIEDSHIHDGHRARMRSKLLTHGARIFDSYELLEMLLYCTIPFKDTNPVAKRLLSRFGDIDGVLSATRDELCEVSGVGGATSDFLISVGRLGSILGAELLPDFRREFSDYETIGEYLVSLFKSEPNPCVYAFFLDNGMRLLDTCRVFSYDYDSGAVRPKQLIDLAVSNGAAVVITAHNHPYGPFYPTPGDRATNRAITDALDGAGILHAEHYLVSGDSYAGIGSLANFSSKFSQYPTLDDFLKSKESHESAHRISSVTDPPSTLAPESVIGYNERDIGYFSNIMSLAGFGEAVSLELMKKYHTIENVFTVSTGELKMLFGERCTSYIKLLAAITSRRRTDAFVFGEVYSSAEIADYLKALYIGESVEKIHLIAFDSSDAVIGCAPLGEGTINSSEVLPRKAIEAAISLGAVSVAIAHNHPFGTPFFSDDDLSLTKSFSKLFLNCDITLKGHYIVAGQLCDTVPIEV